jgi:hypothetical protein
MQSLVSSLIQFHYKLMLNITSCKNHITFVSPLAETYTITLSILTLTNIHLKRIVTDRSDSVSDFSLNTEPTTKVLKFFN